MAADPILAEILAYFLASAERDSFNGIVADSLLKVEGNPEHLRAHVATLVGEEKVTCVFASTDVNMHIKRFPSLPIDKQLSLIKTEDLKGFCVYPTGSEVAKHADTSRWNDRPFTKALVLTEPQLAYRAFDMGVLERYTNDPRYVVHFADYMGRMSIGNEPFGDEHFPDRDEVSLQTFGLGFSKRHIPHAIVFLRYLAPLSLEHQQYWNSYLAGDEVLICKQYYQSSILGEFWKNRSVRYAIIEEMRLVNEMSQAVWGSGLFRELPTGDVPIGLTSFLRPTADNFHRLVMALDKLLSESINIKFFEGKVPLEKEIVRPDGKIQVERKGSLRLLEEWLLSEIVWKDEKAFRDVVIAPLREVRKLRQAPAHTFTADKFSTEYYDTRRKLLWSVFNSLSNVRRTFAKHPDTKDIKSPPWLDEDEIDVF